MKRSKRSAVALVALVVLLLAVAVSPALAAGNVPTTGRFTTLIYTASSGSQPQGAFSGGQYVRLATADCPAPARMLVDGVYVYGCPPSVKLPPLPPLSQPQLLP